jgi:hypothetical protein
MSATAVEIGLQRYTPGQRFVSTDEISRSRNGSGDATRSSPGVGRS